MNRHFSRCGSGRCLGCRFPPFWVYIFPPFLITGGLTAPLRLRILPKCVIIINTISQGCQQGLNSCLVKFMQIQWPTLFQQQTTEGGRFSPDTMVLRAGDQLTAAVLEVENGRDALLSLGQFKAYARMPMPVVSGQNVQIRVESEGNEQGLRLMMVPQQQRSWSTDKGGQSSADSSVRAGVRTTLIFRPKPAYAESR